MKPERIPIKGQRVSWECFSIQCPTGKHFGKVWKPNIFDRLNAGIPPHWKFSDWRIAKKLGRTDSVLPERDRPYVMVECDDRPGVLDVRYIDHLRFYV